MKQIDYYIYLDYSESLIGYTIIPQEKVDIILPKITKFHHYKKVKHKKAYLSAIKKLIRTQGILDHLFKYKIKNLKDNLSIFVEIIDFIRNNDNCIIFASIDNNQYSAFIKLFDMIPHKTHVIIRKESKLKKESIEYKLSLIIDTLLNIKMSK